MRAYLKERLSLFKNKNFFWYFLSCILTTFGGGLLYINLTWLVVHVEKTVMSVALILICFWLPMVLFSPIMGVISDRYPRKWLLAIADFYRGGIFLIFLIWLLVDYHIYEVYALMFFEGIGLALGFPVVFGLVRELVPKEQLMSANATSDMGYEVGNVLGMGLAGFIIYLLGWKWALILNMLCFFLAGLCVLAIKLNVKEACGIKSVTQVLSDYLESIKYVFARKKLFRSYMTQLLFMAQFMTIAVLLAPFATHILHASIVQFSLIEVGLSAGVILGGVLIPWIAQTFGEVKTIFVSIGIVVISYFIFMEVTTVIWAMIIFFIIGFAYGAWPVVMTRSQQMTALHYQGRVQSTFNTLASAAVLFVYWFVGLGGLYIPVNYLYSIEAVFALIALVFVLLDVFD